MNLILRLGILAALLSACGASPANTPASVQLPTRTPRPTFTLQPTVTSEPTSTPILFAPTASLEITNTPQNTVTPTESQTALPTATRESSTNGDSLMILSVNKRTEYVDIQNVSNEPVNLSGWILVSERGNQSCGLSGVLQPNEALRIWAGTGDTGFSCGFSGNIWNNSEPDPAALYNPQGKEVSRYP